MAFDAGILRAVIRQIGHDCIDGRTDKIYQPERDEVVFVLRAGGKEHRLLINAGSSCPRMNLTGSRWRIPPPHPCSA